MRSTDDAEQEAQPRKKRIDRRLVKYSLAWLLVLACGIYAIVEIPSQPTGKQVTAAVLSYEQYAQEAMDCPPQATKAMSEQQLRQVVNDYRKAKQNPKTSRLSDMHSVDIAQRVAYNPDPASSSHIHHYEITVGFEASVCGFSLSAVDFPGYFGEYKHPAQLPDNVADEIIFLDSKGHPIQVPKGKICFGYAFPTVHASDDHNVAHAPCNRMMDLANG